MRVCMFMIMSMSLSLIVRMMIVRKLLNINRLHIQLLIGQTDLTLIEPVCAALIRPHQILCSQHLARRAPRHHLMREQQSTLLTGKGTEEHLSLIHSWLGHLLYVAVQRIKRLARGSVAYQELRQNTLRLICRARRALVNVWRRYVDTKRIGFKGPELWAFRTGYDEAELFAGHTSRAEMRAAFDYASDMCKRKGYKIIEGSYQC